MAFTIDRHTYELKSAHFDGLPRTQLEGDVEPDVIVTFTVELKEGYSNDLRDSLNRHTFWADFAFGEYAFRVRDASLVRPLAERDHSSLLLNVVFKVRRDCIIGLVRPRGQYPHNPENSWNQALYVWCQDRDHLRRKRLELEQYEAEVAERRRMLAAAEAALDVRKSHLVERSTPEQLHAATSRGF